MLVFPELFVPNSPVMGAKRILSIVFQDLKFDADSSVIMWLLHFAVYLPRQGLHIDVRLEKIQL